MKIIYAQGVRFNGGGVGRISYQAARALERHQMLQQVLCGSYNPSDIPGERIQAMGLINRGLRKLAMYDTTGWVSYLQMTLFDAWTTGRLVPADILHVWCGNGLRSLQRAKQLHMHTILEHPSSHPRFQAGILKDEYARWGMHYHDHEPTLKRHDAEITLTDRVLVPSEYARTSFTQQGVPGDKLICLPFGVDTLRFGLAEAPHGRPFRVLFVGQLGLRKGLPYLLQAWELLNWQDAELWLVGRFDAGVQRRFGNLLQQRGVRHIGYSADPSEAFRSADVFAFPTLDEGSALVTYEALASGIPVITTPNAGSIVSEGVNGFLISIHDSITLAQRLQQLRDDTQLRLQMGQAARRRAEEYTWWRYGENLVALATALVGR